MFRSHDYPINHFLEKLRQEYRRKGSDVEFLPFTYNADFLPLAASATANVVSTTDHDSDFIIMQSMQATFTSPAGVFTKNPNILVRITHDVSGRRFEDRDTALTNTFGHGERPFPWMRPAFIPAKSSFTTTLSNQDAGNAFTVRLSYWGVKAVPIAFK